MEDSVEYVRDAGGRVLPVIRKLTRGPRKRPVETYLVEDGGDNREVAAGEVTPLTRDEALAERGKTQYAYCQRCSMRERVGVTLSCGEEGCPRVELTAKMLAPPPAKADPEVTVSVELEVE